MHVDGTQDQISVTIYLAVDRLHLGRVHIPGNFAKVLDICDQGVWMVRHVHAEEGGPRSYGVRHVVPRAKRRMRYVTVMSLLENGWCY